MNRRKFLAFLGIGTAAAVTGAKLLSEVEPEIGKNFSLILPETTGQVTSDVVWHTDENGEKSWSYDIRPGGDFEADNERWKKMYFDRERKLLWGEMSSDPYKKKFDKT